MKFSLFFIAITCILGTCCAESTLDGLDGNDWTMMAPHEKVFWANGYYKGVQLGIALAFSDLNMPDKERKKRYNEVRDKLLPSGKLEYALPLINNFYKEDPKRKKIPVADALKHIASNKK